MFIYACLLAFSIDAVASKARHCQDGFAVGFSAKGLLHLTIKANGQTTT